MVFQLPAWLHQRSHFESRLDRVVCILWSGSRCHLCLIIPSSVMGSVISLVHIQLCFPRTIHRWFHLAFRWDLGTFQHLVPCCWLSNALWVRMQDVKAKGRYISRIFLSEDILCWAGGKEQKDGLRTDSKGAVPAHRTQLWDRICNPIGTDQRHGS